MLRAHRRAPRALLAVIVLALCATAGGSAASGSAAGVQAGLAAQDTPPYWLAQGPGITSFGAFAGYIWRGDVRSVAASFTVPRLMHSTHGGAVAIAGTWIGAQAPGSSRAPFIQVGFNEEQIRLPGTPALDFYYAFWSDTNLSFHPKVLFQVRPGDKIGAHLRLEGGRWHVLIADFTHRRRKAFATRDETGGAFNQAEWLQEDVTERPGHLLPYPQLSTVGFRHLKVNSDTPWYSRVSSQWMSENGTDLAPRPLVDDAFSLAPTQPTALGLHYLQITVPLDVALRGFTAALPHWGIGMSVRTMTSQRAAMASALESDIQEVAGTDWPAGLQGLSQKLLAATRSELGVTERAPLRMTSGTGRWLTDWLKADAATVRISQEMRRVLGLPQAFPLPKS